MNVLLALDMSEASERVLNEVLTRPWPAGSAFLVLNVVEPLKEFVLGPLLEEREQSAHKMVSRVTEKLRAQGFSAEGAVSVGDPRTTILERAQEWHSKLILVGAHGGGALERFLLGSVSRAVLGHAHCSVEVVRGPERSAAQSFKILLAVNGSEASGHAAKAVAGLPWPDATEVRVLSAVELHLGFFRAAFEIPALDPTHLQPQKEEAMQRAQQAIRAALETLEPAGVKLSESLSVLLEAPKQIILEEAEQWGADLIVLGSHGLRGVSRFLMGSTSEAVATHAKCSVMIVRA